jgi:uncharacterized protein
VKINISNLSQGTHEYKLSKSAAELELHEHFNGDVTSQVTLEKSARQILLRVGLRSSASFQCDRCLEDFTKEISPSFQIVYVWDGEERSAEREEDIRILRADTNIIDISDAVRDTLLVAIPLKLLCKEDCAGLCPKCGKNLNHAAGGSCDCAPDEIDSRWNKLAGFVEVSMSKKKN